MSNWAVVSDPDRAYEFITRSFELGRSQHWKGLCQLHNGEVVAAAGYDTFTTHNCFLHLASDGSRKWMTRHFLHETFKYPFVTAGCERITAWIEKPNLRSRAIARRTGFTQEAVLEKAGRDGVDVLIYRMFRQECRYA